jgi:hypothetical protein
MADSYEIQGQTVTMPVEVRDASTGTAVFRVPVAAARELIPTVFEPKATGKCVEVNASGTREWATCDVAITIIDYRDNDLGSYHEIGVTFFARPMGAAADGSADGTYIWRLPVDQSFTCEAGRTIWGFPKTVEEIDWSNEEASVTATLRMDGELVLRLTVPRVGDDEIHPVRLVNYSLIDGKPFATDFTQGGSGSGLVMSGAGVSLELGDHPVAKELASLGLPSDAMYSTWTEHMRGTFAAPRPL